MEVSLASEPGHFSARFLSSAELSRFIFLEWPGLNSVVSALTRARRHEEAGWKEEP